MFLSTPPSRVATHAGFGKTCRRLRVSIHATLAGGDVDKIFNVGRRSGVSIHATLAGGDQFLRAGCRGGLCFYPRHPRGWRQAAGPVDVSGVEVSIHATLAGGDNEMLYDSVMMPNVSIHATLAGGDI